MKRHIDLRIRGGRPELIAFLGRLTHSSDAYWMWAPDLENYMAEDGDAPAVRVFRGKGDEGQRASTVWLMLDDDEDCIQRLNILPAEPPSFTVDECNSILIDFHERVIRPNLNGLNVEMSSDYFRLTDFLPAIAAEALEHFSRSANRATGTAQTSDEALFLHFLILTYRARSEFSPDQLEGWLRDQGWKDNAASEIAIQFEQGLALLERYDRTLAHPQSLESPHPYEWDA